MCGRHGRGRRGRGHAARAARRLGRSAGSRQMGRSREGFLQPYDALRGAEKRHRMGPAPPSQSRSCERAILHRRRRESRLFRDEGRRRQDAALGRLELAQQSVRFRGLAGQVRRTLALLRPDGKTDGRDWQLRPSPERARRSLPQTSAVELRGLRGQEGLREARPEAIPDDRRAQGHSDRAELVEAPRLSFLRPLHARLRQRIEIHFGQHLDPRGYEDRQAQTDPLRQRRRGHRKQGRQEGHGRALLRRADVEELRGQGALRRVGVRADRIGAAVVDVEIAALPLGLANSSGLVGKNLISHTTASAGGYLKSLKGRDVMQDDGTESSHAYIASFYWDKPHPDFPKGYHIIVDSGTRLGVGYPGFAHDPAGFGSDFKREVRERFPALINLYSQNGMIPSPERYVELDPKAPDKYGLPAPKIHFNLTAEDRAIFKDATEKISEIIEASGGVISYTQPRPGVDSVHYVGTCKMGNDPKTSVLTPFLQSHDVENLYVADGSGFIDYSEKNPTLTVMALASRSADHICEQLRLG